MTVNIQLPVGATKEEIRAWAHGPLWGSVTISDETTVRLEVSPLPENQYWEGRILFPTRLLPGARLTRNTSHLEEVIEEETRWAEEANAERLRAAEELDASRRRQRGWFLGSLLLSVIAVLYWMRLYTKYGRSFQLSFRGNLFSDIPSGLPAVLVSYLVNRRQIGPQALPATLFDLARRGFLTIREERKRVRRWFGEKDETDYIVQLKTDHYSEQRSALEPFERDVIEFLFGELAGGLRANPPAVCCPDQGSGGDQGPSAN